jgi:hypothetical protein
MLIQSKAFTNFTMTLSKTNHGLYDFLKGLTWILATFSTPTLRFTGTMTDWAHRIADRLKLNWGDPLLYVLSLISWIDWTLTYLHPSSSCEINEAASTPTFYEALLNCASKWGMHFGHSLFKHFTELDTEGHSQKCVQYLKPR